MLASGSEVPLIISRAVWSVFLPMHMHTLAACLLLAMTFLRSVYHELRACSFKERRRYII